jgi:aldehyde dehydrogenase (NAD+)
MGAYPGPTKLLIDGKWVDAASGKTFETRNPATGELLARVAEGDAEDINRAVAAARRAFNGPWSRMKPNERQLLLLKLADIVDKNMEELALLDTLDMGGPLSRTRNNRQRAVGMLRYYAGMATSVHGETINNSLAGDIFSYTLKEPVGVVGAIIPWNGPLTASIWKIGPALATGCTVVLKPAEEAPLTSLRLGELCLEAGVPPGVVNVVAGYGETAGAALSSHPDVDKVAFTGSHLTGQKIIQASAGNLKRVSLELGGKSPDIVFADADLDRAAATAPYAVFDNAGQDCCARSRILVQRSVFDRFMELLEPAVMGVRVGDPALPETQMGPLISAAHRERVASYVPDGAPVAFRGAAPGGPGFWFPPTVLAPAGAGSPAFTDEVFGPVVTVTPFEDEADAVTIANDTPFGLSGSIWTENVGRAIRVARGVETGNLSVNSHSSVRYWTPFGGFKQSGLGRELGPDALDSFTEVKNVFIAS